MDYVIIAAILAVIYLVYNAQRALAEEATRVPASGPPRYRLLSENRNEPILTQRIYRDGPLSWVAETPGGDRIIAYSANASEGPPPQLLRAVRQI